MSVAANYILHCPNNRLPLIRRNVHTAGASVASVVWVILSKKMKWFRVSWNSSIRQRVAFAVFFAAHRIVWPSPITAFSSCLAKTRRLAKQTCIQSRSKIYPVSKNESMRRRTFLHEPFPSNRMAHNQYWMLEHIDCDIGRWHIDCLGRITDFRRIGMCNTLPPLKANTNPNPLSFATRRVWAIYRNRVPHRKRSVAWKAWKFHKWQWVYRTLCCWWTPTTKEPMRNIWNNRNSIWTIKLNIAFAYKSHFHRHWTNWTTEKQKNTHEKRECIVVSAPKLMPH